MPDRSGLALRVFAWNLAPSSRRCGGASPSQLPLDGLNGAGQHERVELTVNGSWLIRIYFSSFATGKNWFLP
jgi:hypothetical protein